MVLLCLTIMIIAHLPSPSTHHLFFFSCTSFSSLRNSLTLTLLPLAHLLTRMLAIVLSNWPIFSLAYYRLYLCLFLLLFFLFRCLSFLTRWLSPSPRWCSFLCFLFCYVRTYLSICDSRKQERKETRWPSGSLFWLLQYIVDASKDFAGIGPNVTANILCDCLPSVCLFVAGWLCLGRLTFPSP